MPDCSLLLTEERLKTVGGRYDTRCIAGGWQPRWRMCRACDLINLRSVLGC